MIILKANNKLLTVGAKFSYLTLNYASGVTSVVVSNVDGFLADDFVLLGEVGNENTELIKIASVTTATNTLSFGATTTKFAHSESTKVAIVKYNQVKFYRTTAATFATTSLLSTVNLQPDDFYTRYYDGTNTSGYGWFVFYSTGTIGGATSQFDITLTAGTTYRYTWDGTGTDPNINSRVFVGSEVVTAAANFAAGNNGTFTVTGVGTNYFEVLNAAGVVEDNKTIGAGSITVNNVSTNSNAIPYADFAANSVKMIIDSFYSLLNNKEISLVDQNDAFRWLNEAYAVAQNELNLVNQEYNVQTKYTINITSGTDEYALPADFSSLIGVFDNETYDMENVSIRKILPFSSFYVASNRSYYYLRGSYIGFVPSPTTATTVDIYYIAGSAVLTSLYDNINLPNNNFYFLVDHMMYRASQKLGKPNPQSYEQMFEAGIARMKMTSIKQSANRDVWEIESYANV